MSQQIFEKLFVISDIHLGGAPGFQIFDQGPQLSWLIQHITHLETNGLVGLVLNGDVVDFLAEEPAMYLDSGKAIPKLNRIMDDPSFASVWQACATLVTTPNRRLIFVLGNHDVELAFPEVQEFIYQKLCEQNEAARGRLSFQMSGHGFACRVGTAKVLCMHGNESDDWNPVDHHSLSKVIQAQNRDMPIPSWTPNAGTKMVIDIMNDVKREFAWVDLLKPETKIVPKLLFALRPQLWPKLRLLPAIGARKVWDGWRKNVDLLSVEDQQTQDSKEIQQFENDMMTTFHIKRQDLSGTDMLDQILADMTTEIERGTAPEDFLDPESDVELLGFGGAIVDLIRGRSTEDNMHDALKKWTDGDQTFQIDFEDDTFKTLDSLAGSSIDFLIAGHTHLRRAIKRQNGSGFYFNSGTWIRLMEITQEMLGDKTSFNKLWQILENGKMETLDNPASIGIEAFQVVKRYPTVVCVETTEKGSVLGQLKEVTQNEDYYLESVPNTCFETS